MVKLGDSGDFYQSPDLISAMIFSIGLVALVISLFYGIKLKWFRYRLTMNQEESPVMLRSHSVTEIRENCSTGTYRQSATDEMLITNDNEFRLTSIRSPSPSSVKLKSSSIFRWPFRSKISLTRSTSSGSSNNDRVSTIESAYKKSERREYDPVAEKNERLRKSIYERLNSSSSMSMPDLVQCEDQSTAHSSQFLTIRKGIEMSLAEDTIDELQEISVPIKPKITEAYVDNSVQDEPEEMIEEEEIPPRPPTPIRRRSRTNSLKPQEPKQEENVNLIQNVPPPIIPRKKNINYSKLPVKEDQTDSTEISKQDEDIGTMTPKSILKTQNVDSTHQTKANVQFINVPDSSSDDEDYETNNIDVWQKIDLHREELMKKSKQAVSPSNSPPPPLPKTPPPTAEDQNRDFSFA